MNKNLAFLTNRAEREAKADAFVRAFHAMALAQGSYMGAEQVLTQNGGNQRAIHFIRALVGALTTGNTTELLADDGVLIAFMSILEDQSLLSRMLNTGAMVNMPSRSRLVAAAAPMTAAHIDEGKPIALQLVGFDEATVPPITKIGAMIALTNDLLQSMGGGLEFIRKILAATMAKALDQSLMIAVPASSSITAPVDDLMEVIGLQIASINTQAGSRIVAACDPYTAAILAGLDLYQNGFTPDGGKLAGVNCVVSEGVTGIVFMAAGKLAGSVVGFDFKSSDKATIQMLDNPTNTPMTPTATNMVSMFQTNSTAFKALVGFTLQTLADDVRADVIIEVGS